MTIFFYNSNNYILNQFLFESKLLHNFFKLIFLFDFLPISLFIFFMGLINYLENSNFIVIIINIELMILGINFFFISISIYFENYLGQLLALCFLSITAAETAVGLCLLILIYRTKNKINFIKLNIFK